MIIRKTANYWVPFVIILAMVGMTFLNLRVDRQTEFVDYFAPRWSAARNWMREGWSPYSDETHDATLSLLKENNAKADEISKGNFLDPVWYVIFYIPISFVPYPIAKAIWMTLIQISVGVSIYLALQLSGIELKGLGTVLTVILGMLFYPFVRDYLAVNMMSIFVMLTLLGVKLALAGQGMEAGLLFLLALWGNPGALFVMILLLLILGGRRDNSMMRMVIVGFAFFLITTLILFPGWVGDWFANIILLEPGLDWLSTPWMGLSAVFPGASRQISIFLHLGGMIMLLVEWYGISKRNERSIQWKLMLTLTISYFYNLYSDGSALLLILPGYFTIIKYFSEKWPFTGKIVYWIGYIGVGILSWRFVPNPFVEIPKAHGVILLLVPLIVFLGLQWFRWWATASPKALVESNKITG